MESIGGSNWRGCERRNGMGWEWMDGKGGWERWAWSKQKFEAHAVVSNRYKYPRREDWGEKPQTDEVKRGEEKWRCRKRAGGHGSAMVGRAGDDELQSARAHGAGGTMMG